VRVTDLLTASDVRAAGFQVVATEESDEPGRAVTVRARRGPTAWDLGLGLHDEVGGAAAVTYFREVVDALGTGAEPVPNLGDEAVYAAGWLYVRSGDRVFWVCAESPEAPRGQARDAALRLAIPVLARVDRLPAAHVRARAPAPAGATAKPVVPPQRDDEPLLVDPRPRRRALIRHWRALVPGAADQAADMVRRYDVTGRSHDAAELLDGLRTAEALAESSPCDVADLDALLLAVWFHAAVLDRHGDIDAAASAALAREVLTAARVRPSTVGEVVGLVAAGDAPAEGGDGGVLALVLPCRSDTAATLRLAAAVLRPDTTAAGSYPRGHIEHVRLAYEGGGFVVTDDRGRKHTLAREGDDAPGSLGVVVRAGLLYSLLYRTGPPHVFVVLDRLGRQLARDRQAGLWPVDDVERFARATGLQPLSGPIEMKRKWGRDVVRIDTRGRRIWLAFAPMIVLTVAAIVAGTVAGVPIWLSFPLAIVGCIAGIAFLLDRALDMVKKGEGHRR
jgi:hypothetical protein